MPFALLLVSKDFDSEEFAWATWPAKNCSKTGRVNKVAQNPRTSPAERMLAEKNFISTAVLEKSQAAFEVAQEQVAASALE